MGFLAGKRLLITGLLSNRFDRLRHCQGDAKREGPNWHSAPSENVSGPSPEFAKGNSTRT